MAKRENYVLRTPTGLILKRLYGLTPSQVELIIAVNELTIKHMKEFKRQTFICKETEINHKFEI